MFFGLHVENGRIKGEMKKALREVIEKYELEARITPNQNIILCNIRPSWRSRITKLLAPVGLLVSGLLTFVTKVLSCKETSSHCSRLSADNCFVSFSLLDLLIS